MNIEIVNIMIIVLFVLLLFLSYKLFKTTSGLISIPTILAIALLLVICIAYSRIISDYKKIVIDCYASEYCNHKLTDEEKDIILLYKIEQANEEIRKNHQAGVWR